MNRKEITQDIVKECFIYSDGELLWNKGARKGRKAGYFDKSRGRNYVKFLGGNWKISRLVFFMHHGFLPKYVDHIDNDSRNDRLENLRACTRSQNNKNRRKPRNNSSGTKGIYFNKRSKRWIVGIRNDGEYFYGGSFKQKEEAEIVANKMRKNLHGKFANDK